MTHSVRLGALALVVALSGCSHLIDKMNNLTDVVTGAEAVTPDKDQLDAIRSGDAAKKKEALLELVAQSYQNCASYERRLVLGSRSSNFAFDTASTVFSTLGTVFTHVDVIHGFTAATAIATGTKTALDADVYQNATAPIMVQALKKNYVADMAKLEAQLKKPDGTNPGIELSDINRVNGECSLTTAMDQLQSLEQSSGAPTTNSRTAFNSDVASLATANPPLTAAQKTSLEDAMKAVGASVGVAGDLTNDRIQLMAWAVKPTTTDAMVQQMDATIKTFLP